MHIHVYYTVCGHLGILSSPGIFASDSDVIRFLEDDT
jgi:hypothetical protein